MMKVLVCQRGARHRYAIPRILEEMGVLAGLYTDSSAYSLLGRMARFVPKIGRLGAKARSLASRVPAGVPAGKIYSFDRPLYASIPGFQWLGNDLSKEYMRKGLHGADVIYSMYGEDFEFLASAKKNNVRLIVDVFISPMTDRIMQQEHERIFSRPMLDERLIETREQHSRKVFELADIILCPSEWVKEGVLEHTDAASKIRVLPYGSSVALVGELPKKRSKTFLFAGRDALRKGLHFFADAAARVKESDPDWIFCVAGLEAGDVAWMNHAEHLKFLGDVPADRMRELYLESAAMVLPSLSEGQASVALEAMACGCVPIVTRESGVDLPSGVGFVSKARDVDSIVSACKQFIKSHNSIISQSEMVREHATQYSMGSWKQRLAALLEEL